MECRVSNWDMADVCEFSETLKNFKTHVNASLVVNANERKGCKASGLSLKKGKLIKSLEVKVAVESGFGKEETPGESGINRLMAEEN